MGLKGDYVVVDIETTGLSREAHRITEIAAVKYSCGSFSGEFQTLVNPQHHIPSFITRLTGIDDGMVAKAPTIIEALPDFLGFLGSDVLVAHNASFDYGFLNHNAKAHLDAPLMNPRLCTRKLASRLLPDLPSRRLGCICEHFRIENQHAHRAMPDARSTAEVFRRFIRMMEARGIKTIPEMIKFESTPRRRALEIRPKR